MNTTSSLPKTGWRAALMWGIGITLVHRILLTLWLALAWNVVGQYLGDAAVDFHTVGAQIPHLETQLEQTIFGVWRRWDAIHYLDLAQNGYRLQNPGATVFGVLTPLGFRVFDAVLPGSLDLAAMVFETVAFAAALVLLYRVCEVYYGDAELGAWSVAVVALFPLSYFFAAPMSESIYLALVLGVFYFAAKDRWAFAAVSGFLATLARSQGALLFFVVILLLLEKHWHENTQWSARIRTLVKRGWVLVLIPLGAILFSLYRAQLQLPPLDEVYAQYSFVFFTNPLDGLLANLRWIANHPAEALYNVDVWGIFIFGGLALAASAFKKHRRLPLLAYTFGYLLVFISKLNWQWGTDEAIFTQSFARYCLALFPLFVLIGDGLRHTTFWGRILLVLLLGFGLLALSGLYVFALTGP
ncbi:MAG TPA: hypothetical protein VK003_06895 [Oceanobacillus sp.]|nr:hypothetical protein [Oceanobacillus sp.]